MHRSALRRGEVIRIGHHPTVILEVREGGAKVRDDRGYKWFEELPEEVLLSGYASEGLHTNFDLGDR